MADEQHVGPACRIEASGHSQLNAVSTDLNGQVRTPAQVHDLDV
jgi:hypothetical protein